MRIALRAAVFLLVTSILGVASFFMFAFMIVAMNGFTESDAEWGLLLFIVWAIAGVLISGVGSVLLSAYLVGKKELNEYVASLISLLFFVAIGGILNFVGCIAGLAAAEFVRTTF